MIEKVYDSHHRLILILRDQKLSKTVKCKILPMIPCKKCKLNFKIEEKFLKTG